MRKRKASFTAQGAAYRRALGTISPTVPGFSDPMAEKFLPDNWQKKIRKARNKLPGSPYPVWYRGMGVCNQFRSVVLDRAILAARPFEQLVILGAGFDGRAWRLAGMEKTIVFEVDHPETQQLKQKKVLQYRPAAKEVRFAGVDFTRDNLTYSLMRAGFDPDKRTCWIWEAVIMYLTPEEVENTLTSISECSAPGSSIAFTYLARRNGKIPRSMFLTLFREPVRSAYTPGEMRVVMKNFGWHAAGDTGIEDWKRELTPDLKLNRRNVGLQWYERVFTGKR